MVGLKWVPKPRKWLKLHEILSGRARMIKKCPI